MDDMALAFSCYCFGDFPLLCELRPVYTNTTTTLGAAVFKEIVAVGV